VKKRKKNEAETGETERGNHPPAGKKARASVSLQCVALIAIDKISLNIGCAFNLTE